MLTKADIKRKNIKINKTKKTQKLSFLKVVAID